MGGVGHRSVQCHLYRGPEGMRQHRLVPAICADCVLTMLPRDQTTDPTTAIMHFYVCGQAKVATACTFAASTKLSFAGQDHH